jgi:hypothetical protein
MSFIINGVGFHILVSALPVQVAGQGSLTGVVFRAVGMLYLVDLDDTPGFTLTIVENEQGAVGKPGDKPDKVEQNESTDDEDVDASAAQAIIDEARAKLDELAKSKGLDQPVLGGAMTGVLATAAAGAVAGRGLDQQKRKQETRQEDREGGGDEEQGYILEA